MPFVRLVQRHQQLSSTVEELAATVKNQQHMIEMLAHEVHVLKTNAVERLEKDDVGRSRIASSATASPSNGMTVRQIVDMSSSGRTSLDARAHATDGAAAASVVGSSPTLSKTRETKPLLGCICFSFTAFGALHSLFDSAALAFLPQSASIRGRHATSHRIQWLVIDADAATECTAAVSQAAFTIFLWRGDLRFEATEALDAALKAGC